MRIRPSLYSLMTVLFVVFYGCNEKISIYHFTKPIIYLSPDSSDFNFCDFANECSRKISHKIGRVTELNGLYSLEGTVVFRNKESLVAAISKPKNHLAERYLCFIYDSKIVFVHDKKDLVLYLDEINKFSDYCDLTGDEVDYLEDYVCMLLTMEYHRKKAKSGGARVVF